LRIQRAKAKDQDNVDNEVAQQQPTKSKYWAKLIARTFGEIPTICPRCGEEMQLTGFVFDARILSDFDYFKRAPPRMTVTKYSQIPKQPTIETSQNQDKGTISYKQSMPDYENFDQTISW